MTLIDKAEALLPCPFCGNDDIQDWGESTWSRPVKWMYCTECQARGPRVMLGRGEPKDHWHHRIREEWNTRAALAPTDAAQAREAAIRECASALRKVIDYAAFAGADPDEVDDEAINSYADYLLTLIEKEPRA